MTEEQKDKDFIKLFRSHIDDITNLAKENSKAYDLFMLLLKNMDGNNALCVSNTVLQELLDCGKATIFRAVKYLKEHGWICVLKNGTSNVYIVNPDVAWTSYANEKKYCKFQATVLLSSTENNEFLNNSKAFTHFKTIDKDFIQSVMNKKEEFKQYTENINQEEKDKGNII